MLTDVLDDLANDVIPALFDDAGTELMQIIRDGVVVNDYGHSETSTTDAGDELPCVLYTKAGTRWQLGQEFLDGRIQMPAAYGGEAVDVRMTDKVKILEREGNNPERLFAVKDIQNVHGVYLDVGVMLES